MPFLDKHNIIPNNVNHVLAFIQRRSKSEHFVDKCIRKWGGYSKDYSLAKFYSYQLYIKEKCLTVHVNTRALELVAFHREEHSSVFSLEEQ